MNIIWRALAALTIVGSAACTSLPDTSGYTAATSALSSAITAAGDLAHVQLVASFADLQTEREAAQRDARMFREAWDRTSSASQQMVDYAESIEAITASASEAGADIDAVGSSLGELAKAAGIANPLASEAGGIVLGIAREVWTQVRLAQAAGDLETALAAADPAVQRITVHLQEQITNLERLWNGTMADRDSQLFLRYGNVATAYQRLHSEYGVMLSDYATAQGADRERRGREIEAVRAQYESARQIAELYERETAEVAATRALGLRLIATTRSALASWRAAHARLKTAVEERKPVNVQSLVAAAQRLRAVVDEARNQE